MASSPVRVPCIRCGGTPPFACSLPSLSKVSTHNRSLQGTNPQSRGDSSLELEAIAAVHELSFAVQSISVSEMLPRTPELIFVNVTTIEGQPYCLELTMKGWRVTSLRQDCMQGDFTRLDLFTKYFDTLYDLMDEISPGYRNRFSEKLAQKLRMLQAGEDCDFVAPASSYANTPLLGDSPLHFHAHSLSPFSSSTSSCTAPGCGSRVTPCIVRLHDNVSIRKYWMPEPAIRERNVCEEPTTLVNC